MNPGPFTLRELHRMAEGKRADEWDRASWIISTIANAFRGKDAKPVYPWQINPFGKRPKRRFVQTISNPEELTRMFGGK